MRAGMWTVEEREVLGEAQARAGSFDQNRCGRRHFTKCFPCPLSLHPSLCAPITAGHSLKEAWRLLEVT